MSLKKQAVGGFAWTLIQQFGITGVAFIVEMFLGRLISPIQYGIFGLLVIFSKIGNTLSDSGMGQSIIRSNDLDEDDYGTIFLTNLGVSICVFLIIVAISPYVANFYNEPIIAKLLLVYPIAIILTAFSTIQATRLTKQLNFKKQAVIQIPSVIISGIVGIVMGYFNFGVWALVTMYVVKEFVLSVQYWFLTGWRPKIVFNKERFHHHFNFGYKLTLSSLLSTIVASLTTVIIGKYYTKADLGFYTKAGVMRNLPVNNITGALNKVTYPLFSKVKDDKQRLLLAYKKIQNIVLFVMAPLMLALILIAPALFIVVFGERWVPSVFFFNFFAVTGIFYPIHMYNLNILKVSGKSDKYLLAEILKKSNLLIAILSTAFMGLEMLMYGLVYHSFASLFINMYFGAKELGYSIPNQIKDFFKVLIPSLLLFGIFIGVKGYVYDYNQLNSYIQLFTIPTLFAIGYLILNLVLKTPGLKDFLEILQSVPKIDKFAKKAYQNIYK